MNNYITTHEQWLVEYRKDKRAIWVRVCLSDNREIWFKEYKTWLAIKQTCLDHELSVKTIKLQYRSHVVETDTRETEGVYLIRSLMGLIGGSTKNYYTIGIVDGDLVHKTQWLTPELIEEEKVEDPLDKCFEEAIIYNHVRVPNR
jgi:hypothetical protein